MQDKRRKTFWKFVGLMVVCALGGGVVGFVIGMKNESLSSVITMLLDFIGRSGFYVMALIGLGSFLLALHYYYVGKRLFARWDGEEDAKLDEIEGKISFALLFISVGFIFTIVFAGIGLADFKHDAADAWVLIIDVVAMIVITLLLTMLQRRCVELEIALNPEKRGDVLDRRFQKDWIESCDEQERLAVYRSSYRAYQVSQKAAPMIILIMILVSMVTNIGAIPFLAVGGVWLIQSMTYMKSAIKVEQTSINNER